MITNRYTTLLLAGAALTIVSTPAFALDGKDMMDKLSAYYAQSGSSISYASADTEGTTVTVKDVKVDAGEGDKMISLPIGDVTFSDVEETSNGGYQAGTVTISDVDFTKDKVHVTASGLVMKDVSIPATPSYGSLDGMLLYKNASTGPVNVEINGKKVASIASSEADLNVSDDKSSLSFDTKVSGLNIDLSDVKDPKVKDAVDTMGLQTLSGKVAMGGSWDMKTGKAELSEYSMDFDNVGKLNITFSISGYTPSFIQAMQEATKAMQANPDKQAASSAYSMALMGLAQQLSFNGASIRFDDASITKRILDYVGKQQGVTGDQLAQSLKGMLPIMMARLNMPDFQKQVSDAVNAFLDDPKNIEIKAAPANAVPVPMIMGAAMGAPQTIPQVLGVTVSANQ